MTLKADARLLRFRGYFLVTTESKAVEVNRTFADVWDLASNGPFTQESLTDDLVKSYGLPKHEAADAIQEILEVWTKYDLLKLS